jgi:hypothetical protein
VQGPCKINICERIDFDQLKKLYGQNDISDLHPITQHVLHEVLFVNDKLVVIQIVQSKRKTNKDEWDYYIKDSKEVIETKTKSPNKQHTQPSGFM